MTVRERERTEKSKGEGERVSKDVKNAKFDIEINGGRTEKRRGGGVVKLEHVSALTSVTKPRLTVLQTGPDSSVNLQ